MAYQVVNNGRVEGTVRIGDVWRVVRPRERFVTEDVPTSWSTNLSVIKQHDLESLSKKDVED